MKRNNQMLKREYIRLLDNDDVVVDYDMNNKEYRISLFKDNHFQDEFFFKNEPRETVFRGVIAQIRWERDVAIDQLNKLGVGFGQKTKKESKLIQNDKK